MVLESHSSTLTTEPGWRASGDLFDVWAQSDGRLHPRSRMLRHRVDLAPARCLICELHASALRDTQPDYAEDFQTGDFDGALFRLTLFARLQRRWPRRRHQSARAGLHADQASMTAAVDTLTIGAPVSGVDPPVDASAPARQQSDGVGSGHAGACGHDPGLQHPSVYYPLERFQ